MNNQKIITEVTENDADYSWDELNCFYRPFAIMYKTFSSIYYDLFLFYT